MLPPYKPGSTQGFFLLKGSFSLPLCLAGGSGSGFLTSVNHLIVKGAIQWNLNWLELSSSSNISARDAHCHLWPFLIYWNITDLIWVWTPKVCLSKSMIVVIPLWSLSSKFWCEGKSATLCSSVNLWQPRQRWVLRRARICSEVMEDSRRNWWHSPSSNPHPAWFRLASRHRGGRHVQCLPIQKAT